MIERVLCGYDTHWDAICDCIQAGGSVASDGPTHVTHYPRRPTDARPRPRFAATSRASGRWRSPPLQPALLDLSRDIPDVGACDYSDTFEGLCERGDVGSDRSPVAFGDSHARQWIPALESIATRRDMPPTIWSSLGVTRLGWFRISDKARPSPASLSDLGAGADQESPARPPGAWQRRAAWCRPVGR